MPFKKSRSQWNVTNILQKIIKLILDDGANKIPSFTSLLGVVVHPKISGEIHRSPKDPHLRKIISIRASPHHLC